MLRYLALGLILTLPNVLSAKFRFDNYTLYKVFPQNAEHIEFLKNLQENDLRFDFWTTPSKSLSYVNILSSPEHKSDFENILASKSLDFEIPLPNIQEAIDKQAVKSYTKRKLRTMTWDAYYTNDAINAWMDDLAAAYPTIVTRIVGGRSFEGRPIRGVKISHGAGRRAIFIEGGIHAREWIAPATVTYIINELLTSEDKETKAAARDYDWYIFPVTNPDGYVFSHDHFRMWRKNRRPITGTHVGVDLNRNWNNNWRVVGASSNPAADHYAGPGPFSEPESRSLSTYIASLADKIEIYLSFHSFSHLLLVPFGNTTDHLANYNDAVNIGRRAMGSLSARFGTQYTTGNIAETIYQASGGSIDWVKEELKIPLVYVYELRDDGTYGFLLPQEQILPNNLEVMDSIIDLILHAKRFGYLSSGAGLKASIILIVMALIAKFLSNQ